MKTQFRQFFESSPDALLVVDSVGRIRQANAQAESLFGYRHEQVHGELAQTLFPGQQVTWSPPTGPPEQRRPTGRHLELVGRRSDRSQFPADVAVIPIQTAEGPETLVSIKDLSDEQRAQFALELGLDVLQSAERDEHALLGHLLRALEQERARIAADIHDDTIQILSAANLRLQQLRHRLQAPEDLQVLDKLEETLTLSLGRLRQLIFDLRPSTLEQATVADAVRAYLEEMRSELGIDYRVEGTCRAEIPASTSTLIYRTVQEALVNVRKHARAKTVRVQFLDVSEGCLTRISDDGVGYSPAEVEDQPGHLGLTLMRERAEMAGGWCRIESAPGGGTVVEFWVPFESPPEQSGVGRERAA
ncbi:MAG TPA: PAS domain-containing sensor histidine kinase [Streptosporangiaceae bacterium]|nr:PAS domain-containing sensor histidine kinase [Streptosporangiaceae bacterium]